MPNQGVLNPSFLYINIGSLSACTASSTACIQNALRGSALLYFKCLSNETPLYPVLSSSENLSISKLASGFNAMISPDIALLPTLIVATAPLPGDL